MASTKEMNELMMYELESTTFGVEIEMTGITREAAARVAATILPAPGRVWYKGTGYHKWTYTDAQGRDWDFVYDSSIHATGNDETKCELNTPPLIYNKDMKALQALIRALRNAGAVAGAKYECGIHVHVSGKRHTYQTIRNFINLMYSNDELVRKALGIDPARSGRWCKPIEYDLVSAVKNVHSMDQLEDAWYGTYSPYQSRTTHYNNSRYHILNLHRYFSTLGESKNTIEIRAFNSCLDAGVVRSYVLLVLSLNLQALTSKNILAKKNPIMVAGNEKFAMRTWLNRMGWTGEIFKVPHSKFIKRLDGCSAWRFGENFDHYMVFETRKKAEAFREERQPDGLVIALDNGFFAVL